MVICRSPINISAINSCTPSKIDVRKMTDLAASYSIYKIGVFKRKPA